MSTIILCCFSWATFWTALTAIGTIAMAVTTYFALKKNDTQVSEMKRQWVEDNRPYIDIQLVYEHSLSSTASRYLKIENYGKGTANNLQLYFDDSFIDNIPIQELKEQFNNRKDNTYKVLPGRLKKEAFCDIIDLVGSNKCRISKEEFNLKQRSTLLEYLNKPIQVTVRYSWNNKNFCETMTLKYNY